MMRSVGSEGKDRQIDRTVQSKIGVKEKYDKTPDKIAMPKTEYDLMKIASREKETTNKARERAK